MSSVRVAKEDRSPSSLLHFLQLLQMKLKVPPCGAIKWLKTKQSFLFYKLNGLEPYYCNPSKTWQFKSLIWYLKTSSHPLCSKVDWTSTYTDIKLFNLCHKNDNNGSVMMILYDKVKQTSIQLSKISNVQNTFLFT